MNAKACYACRAEKNRPDFDVERPRSGKTRDLLSRKSRKIEREEGTVEGCAGRENARRLRNRLLVSMASRNVSRSNARTFDPVRLSFETASCAEEAKRIADPRYFFFFLSFFSFLALLPATDGVVDASRCALGCTNRKTDTEITRLHERGIFFSCPQIDCQKLSKGVFSNKDTL